VLDQAKIALILVQIRFAKKKVIDLKNKKISKKSPYQENLTSNPFQQILLKK